jgi:ankyrin repeat protein
MKEKLLFRMCDVSSALIANGASVHEANNVRRLRKKKKKLSHFTPWHLQAGDTALHIAVRESAKTAVHQLLTADASVVTAQNKVPGVLTYRD